MIQALHWDRGRLACTASWKATQVQIQALNSTTSQVGKVDPVPAQLWNALQSASKPR